MPHSRYKKERTTTFSPFCSFIVFDLLWEVSPRPPLSALRASEPFSHPFLIAQEWGKPPIQPPVAMRHPPFRGNAGTCCASLAEPGCLPVIASLHFYPPSPPGGRGKVFALLRPFNPGISTASLVPFSGTRDAVCLVFRISRPSSRDEGSG